MIKGKNKRMVEEGKEGRRKRRRIREIQKEKKGQTIKKTRGKEG